MTRSDFLLTAGAAALGLQALPHGRFDVVVRNGRVLDGTGAEARSADIGVIGGRIVAVRPGLPRGRREIDATGLIVAPGFIDVHTHSEEIVTIPRAENYVRQGVTTVVTGNCGSSAHDIGAFLRDVERARPAINVATLVGHNTVRRAAMGGSFDRPPTGDELAAMRRAVRQAMADGAFGLSTGLIYLPGVFSKTDEIVEIARAAAEHGGIYTSHMRSESDEILPALAEVFRVAREAGIRAEVSHIKLSGNQNWGRTGEVIAAFEAARAEGLDVARDQYPYAASSTGISQLIPAWAREGDAGAFESRLTDPAARTRIATEMTATLARRGKTTYDYVTITSYARDRSLNGLSLPEAARQKRGSDTLDAQIDLVLDIERTGGAGAVFHGISEADLRVFMRMPDTLIGSDSGPKRRSKEVPHPRAYGSHARVLGRYVRDLGLITLPDAIRRMTSMAAERFGITDRGVIREGAWADVVVFDPDRIADTATYSAPHSYAVGVPFVLVNGVVVVRNGKHTGVRPGQALRHGRPQPLKEGHV